MKLGLSLLNQIRGGDKDAFGFTAETFDQLVSQIPAAYHMEHTVDDKHSTINATGPISERGRTVPMGEWINLPFDATNYTGNGAMTWTVTAAGVTTLKYMWLGKTLFIAFRVTGSVGGTPNTLLMLNIPQLPPTTETVMSNPCVIADNGANDIGAVAALSQSSQTNLVLSFTTRTVSNWSASAGNTTVQGCLPVITA